VAGTLAKALRPGFEQAVARLAQTGGLPASVAVHEVKGKLFLRRADYPPPLAPEEALASKLLAALRGARQAGTNYPIPLARLIEQAERAAPERLIKAALAHGSFAGQALTALPGKPDSLVALSEDCDRLAGDPRLLLQALTGARTEDNQAIAVAELGKKLAAALRPTFATLVEQHLAGHTLPAGVGCLHIKKKPHLFLLADVGVQAEKAIAPVVVDFARRFDEAFAKLEAAGHGLVSLVDLRRAMAVTREQFDCELDELRRAGRYSLQGAEGRHGISAEERTAGIVEHGHLLLYVVRRETS
jgi:hypothetical protein